jgi:hypothetical protein
MREGLAGELDPAGREALVRHADRCPSCRDEWRGLQETIMGSQRRLKPDPGSEYWDGYWGRLQARMAHEPDSAARGTAVAFRPSVRRSPILRRLALPSAAAALVVAGVLIGRWSIHTPRPSGPVVPVVVQASDLEIRTNRYLDRSKRILLALVNFAPAGKDAYGLDLPGQKTASRALANEAAGLRGDLSKAKERRLERLVGDLQMILLQIANLKSENDVAGVDIIRAGIDGRDVLFQINLARMRSASGSAAVPPAAPDKPGLRGRTL